MISPSNLRPAPDKVLVEIADYVDGYRVKSTLAWETARLTLIDTLGCGFEALSYPACTKLLGPVVPGTVVPNGARVPGTSYVLDPERAALNTGALFRWLDFNDAFYGATVIHPSDTYGGILPVADWLSRTRASQREQPLLVRDVLEAGIKAYEVMGGLAIENGFTNVGLDHTILVKIAVTAVAARMLGATHEEVVNAVSNAWLDGHALAAFRRKPNTGSRKSWAAGDAASRGVRLALMAVKGEMGYPAALTAKRWGFYETLFEGKPFRFQRPFGSYVMENTLFKIPYPTAFHGQSGVEAAIKLHPLVKDRLDDIERIEVQCHNSSMTILDKTGPLYNPADRDHCMQYMIAVGMIYGAMTAEHYEDHIAADPRIDKLRAKMKLSESARYEKDYHDPAKRSNANSIQVYFKDGAKSPLSEVEYPLGHRRRRKEGVPAVMEKFEKNVARVFAARQRERILRVCLDQKRLEATPVNEFMDLLAL
ncbi:MAG: bifunctional aconitate hydratase 2 and 2-methylisocitrate dehydratase (modular protein) [Burkholderiales bacterium]|jgi:2-methylcitrate dehydratase|nr:bifunctional aconitate hydratase 2 and 2-methylisocitrate dehydratase (modular protein) [Burkholderiales bacterium]